MILSICKKEYWDFIGKLRANPKVAYGFCEDYSFNKEIQFKFMNYNSKYFHVCLVNNKPSGYIGLISPNRDEITYCVAPEFQGKGIGTFMVKEIMQLSPNIWAKVKPENKGSIKIFEKLRFKREDKQDFIFFYQK